MNPVKHIGRRLSFYKSKMIVEQMGKHDPYEKIQRAICVCILSWALFPEVKEYLNRFHNRENGLCFQEIPEEEFEMMAERNPEMRKAKDALYTLSAASGEQGSLKGK